MWRKRASAGILIALAVGTSSCAYRATKLLAGGDSRQLIERPEGTPRSSPGRPPILLIALDGVDRKLIYDALRGGEMPALAELLGGVGRDFPHAHFDDSYLSTLPSSTMVAWVTALSGVGPAHHGVTGNEFFVRERREFAAPVPVTFADTAPVIACYTDSYVDTLRLAPSVYERMRARDPNVLVWVAMHQFHQGADRLLLTHRTVIADASEALFEDQVSKHLKQEESRKVFEKLDKEIVDVVLDELDGDPLPDVLTVYLSGTDSYAHVAEVGPDAARREYLRDVVDPLLRKLADRLRERNALSNRWVVVTSDHGHTEVLRDQVHALGMEEHDDPPAVLEWAGFRVRPFALEVPEDDDFQAVLAYQGAMAYVYVADRSTCRNAGQVCDWTRPPRFNEDVLAVAEAFHRADQDGDVPGMRGTLDLVLARRPRPHAEEDLPFEVYIGGGRLVPVDRYLRRHPHPTYVALDRRLRDLAVGPHGERAGDVILVAHNGDREKPEDRYYFASTYRSWHGSPSRRDSELPLIVAHPRRSSATIRAVVRRALGPRPYQQRLTDLLLTLREDGVATDPR